MIAAGLLSVYLLSGGHASLGTALFPADLEKAIRAVVTEQARAEEAAKVVQKARKDIAASVKRGQETAKAFGKTDTAHEARLAELEPLFRSISAERTRAENEALDRVFALRKALTEEEWKAAFARTKK